MRLCEIDHRSYEVAENTFIVTSRINEDADGQGRRLQLYDKISEINISGDTPPFHPTTSVHIITSDKTAQEIFITLAPIINQYQDHLMVAPLRSDWLNPENKIFIIGEDLDVASIMEGIIFDL